MANFGDEKHNLEQEDVAPPPDPRHPRQINASGRVCPSQNVRGAPPTATLAPVEQTH